MSSTWIGCILALGAAVALNTSYLMQHVGSASVAAVDVRHPFSTLRSLLRAPAWTLGAAVGMAGWGLHIGAMGHAPLSIVQAFVAGGLALALPLGALALRRPLAAGEVRAIAVMAVALLALSLGLRAHDRQAAYSPGVLAAVVLGLVLVAAALAPTVRGARRPLVLGTAGGLLYGAADLSLKAVTGAHGLADAVTSPWLAAGLLASAGAFFAFQRGLQCDRPLAVIALMTAATNTSSILGAFAAYGDPLGRTPALAVLHAAALAAVVVAACRLAPAQTRVISGTSR